MGRQDPVWPTWGVAGVGRKKLVREGWGGWVINSLDDYTMAFKCPQDSDMLVRVIFGCKQQKLTLANFSRRKKL